MLFAILEVLEFQIISTEIAFLTYIQCTMYISTTSSQNLKTLFCWMFRRRKKWLKYLLNAVCWHFNVFDFGKHYYKQVTCIYQSGKVSFRCKRNVNFWRKATNIVQFRQQSDIVYIVTYLSKFLKVLHHFPFPHRSIVLYFRCGCRFWFIRSRH